MEEILHQFINIRVATTRTLFNIEGRQGAFLQACHATEILHHLQHVVNIEQGARGLDILGHAKHVFINWCRICSTNSLR